MRLNNKTKRQVRKICRNSKKSTNLFDYFFIKTNGMRPNNVTKNYKILKNLSIQYGKTIKQLPMCENVAIEMMRFTTNHSLYNLNKKLENEYLIDMWKYVYKITKDQSFKTNIERVRRRLNNI